MIWWAELFKCDFSYFLFFSIKFLKIDSNFIDITLFLDIFLGEYFRYLLTERQDE